MPKTKHQILFVAPRYEPFGVYYTFPLGMAYVVAYLKQHCDSAVFSMNLCNHTESVESLLSNQIREKKITVICTGGMSFHWNAVDQVLRAAKAANPSIITVAGGPIATSDPELLLQNMPADFAVIGEGELTMAELARSLENGLQIDKVDGLAYLDKTNVMIKTKEREPIRDLDSLPFPDYEAFEFDKWLKLRWILQPSVHGLFCDYNEQHRMAEIITSRSCPFSCTFCYHPLGQSYRQRSMDNVFMEIAYLFEKYKINLINLLDELFSHDEARVHDFINRLKPYGVKWMAQWRVDNASYEMMKALKDSDIFALGLGVESMSDKVLRSMQKHTTKAKIDQVFAWANEAGIPLAANLIFGDPAETIETAEESLGWRACHPEYDLTLAFILAIPDSKVYRDAIKKGLIKDKLKHIKEGFPVINLTSIPDRVFHKFQRKVLWHNTVMNYMKNGHVISSTKMNIHDGKQLYDFTLKCPHCNSASRYMHAIFSPRPAFPVLCKACYRPMKINTGEVFFDDHNSILAVLFIYTRFIYHFYLKQHAIIRSALSWTRSLRARRAKQPSN